MIRLAAFDGIGAVELFQKNDEGEFVLQSQRRERPDCIALGAEILGVPVGSSDEERDRFDTRLHLPVVDPCHELISVPVLAAFI